MKREGGTYILVMLLETRQCFQIGKLGLCDFPEGYYVYVGSALGGLESRLRRHLKTEKRIHWHIDYLLKSASVVEIWDTYSEQRLECIWNRAVAQLSGATYPVPKFGASDCRCLTHLTHFAAPPILDKFIDILNESGCASGVSKRV